MNLVASIHDYIRRKGGRFFKDWTREALEDKIEFHLRENTISIAVDNDENVCGLLIGWCQKGPNLIPWNWQRNDPKGDYWWWDQYMANDPCAAAAVIIDFCEKWPQAAIMPSACHRRGKLRVYDKPGHLFKIYEKAERLYGN